MTENQSLAADKAADELARASLCSRGPADCPGRTVCEGERVPVQPPIEPTFRRTNWTAYRCGPVARAYLCRFCGTAHTFPVPDPEPTEGGVADASVPDPETEGGR